jgi:hypothetical protein
VYSGVLAEAELNSVLREDAFHGEARIYQDGLETADVAEDCTFAVWIRKHETRGKIPHKRTPQQLHERIHSDDNYIPPFLGKPASQLVLFRARSKVRSALGLITCTLLTCSLLYSWSETSGLEFSRSRYNGKPMHIQRGLARHGEAV